MLALPLTGNASKAVMTRTDCALLLSTKSAGVPVNED
jgi:hypothetical protein